MGGTSGTSVSLSLSLSDPRLTSSPSANQNEPKIRPRFDRVPRFGQASARVRSRGTRAASPLGPPKRGRFPRPVPLTSADDVLRMGGVPEQTTSHMFQGTGRTGVAKLVSLAKCLGIGVLELTPRGILQQ